jgi:hypothetical protein
MKLEVLSVRSHYYVTEGAGKLEKKLLLIISKLNVKQKRAQALNRILGAIGK